MPYKIKKRKCRQSDETPGTHAVVKLKDTGEEQTSCHTSEDSAKGSIRARGANESTIKITKNRLRKIIKEEAADCAKDFRLGTMTREEYEDCLKKFDEPENYNYSGRRNYPPRKTSYVGRAENSDKIAAIESALSSRHNNFLQSVLDQLKNGRGLSSKQNAIAKKILGRYQDPPFGPKVLRLFETARDRAKGNVMKVTDKELRKLVRESLDEGAKEFMQGLGRHGSKIITRPAGIIAKALGRLASSGNSSKYEKNVTANVEGLENLVGSALGMGGSAMDWTFDKFQQAAYKVMPDLHPDEIERLHAEIEAEKNKHGGTIGMMANRMGLQRESVERALELRSSVEKVLSEFVWHSEEPEWDVHSDDGDDYEGFDAEVDDVEDAHAGHHRDDSTWSKIAGTVGDYSPEITALGVGAVAGGMRKRKKDSKKSSK